MADDKVLEDETPEQGTTAAEPEVAEAAAESAAKDPVEPAVEDTYESVSPPENKEEKEGGDEEAAATSTEPEKTNGNVEGAVAETIEVPLDENEAAAQPLTGEKDVEGGPSNEEKSTARIQDRLLRTLRKREILFPLIGGVTFLIGLILIITGLLVMQNKCDSATYSGNGQTHSVEMGTASNGQHDDDNMLIYADKSHMNTHHHDSNITDEESENLAMGHPAFQSTTFMEDGKSYTAALAVDGNTEAKTKKGVCAQTERQARPGWHVDLEAEHSIKRVKIIIPSDCCVGELHDFKVRVGTNDTLTSNPVCKHFMGTALRSSIDMECEQAITGRYVSIHLLGDDVRPRDRLTLCEVMVYSR